ncbi:MAG: hypothetical protein ABI547_04240, partial [Betaproteobacteria bacterium]
GRVVECTGLENRNPGNWIEGSNPSLSASNVVRKNAAASILVSLMELTIAERAGENPPVRLSEHRSLGRAPPVAGSPLESTFGIL